MSVNTEYVGREYPATSPYDVSRVKIAEFADAVGASSEAHRDTAAAKQLGYADVIAPTTFAVVIAQAAEAQYIEDPAAGIDFTRVVHANEGFTHLRPIVAGDQISTVLHVDKIMERGGIAVVGTRCELFDEAGELVSTVTSSLAIRGEDA